MMRKSTFFCNEELRSQISHNLNLFSFKADGRDDTRRAAVAVAVVNVGVESSVYEIPHHDADNAALVLTRRSSRLKNHAGQWAFPGGSIDGAESPEETALREFEEEVGVRLPKEHILGRLDDFTTRSGFTITPIVVWGGNDLQLIPNVDEVDSIHRIPLQEFFREDAPVLQNIPESEDPVLLMPVGQGWIASPTGAIIYQFREVAVKGNHVRVAHYEQPYFAWK